MKFFSLTVLWYIKYPFENYFSFRLYEIYFILLTVNKVKINEEIITLNCISEQKFLLSIKEEKLNMGVYYTICLVLPSIIIL